MRLRWAMRTVVETVPLQPGLFGGTTTEVSHIEKVLQYFEPEFFDSAGGEWVDIPEVIEEKADDNG